MVGPAQLLSSFAFIVSQASCLVVFKAKYTPSRMLRVLWARCLRYYEMITLLWIKFSEFYKVILL